MDVHKIGTFDTAGRFTTLFDLNDGAAISFVRGTFKVTPYQETGIYPKASRRYGGSRQLGELHDNGQIQATWLLSGGSGDATLGVFDDLVEWLESSRQDLFYLWRPDGATRNTYFDLRGGVPWEPLYSWVEFAGANVLQVTGGWQVAPLALGDPLDIFDDFTVDSIADYTFDAGAGTMTVSGSGRLAPSTTAEKRLYHSARGYAYTNAEATLQYITGASLTAGGAGVILRRQDASNYLIARLGTGYSGLIISKVVAGVFTTLVSGAAVHATTAIYWLRFRTEGDVLTAEFWEAQPTPLGTPTTSISYTLTTPEAAQFGADHPGAAGIRVTPAGTDERYDDFQVRPYTYRRAGAQTVAAHEFDLPGVPGTAPAMVDAETTVPSGILALSALIGWAATSAPLAGTRVPFGLLEAEDRDEVDGGAGFSDADYSDGGNHSGTSFGFYVDPSSIPADDFTDSISIEVWAIVGTSGVGEGTIQVYAYPYGDATGIVYTAEYGSADHTFRFDSDGRWLTRAGTLTIPVNGPAKWVLRAVRGGDTANLDALLVVPARQRACTATGQDIDTAQLFLNALTDAETIKTIRHDLSGDLRSPGDTNGYRVPGLSGQHLEFPPGDVTVLHRVGRDVVDPPSSAPVGEDLNTSTMAVHYAITPRYFLARSG